MNIREAVAKRIHHSGDHIKNAVVEHLAGEVIERRVAQVVQGFVELEKVEKELRKIKPDVVTFSEDGTASAPVYSKVAFENRKKHLERQGKLEKALEKALGEHQEYSDLSSLVGKQDDKSKDAKPE